VAVPKPDEEAALEGNGWGIGVTMTDVDPKGALVTIDSSPLSIKNNTVLWCS
jgi:hypothetical protein